MGVVHKDAPQGYLFMDVPQPRENEAAGERVVRLSATASERGIELEFVCGGAGVNLENAARAIDWSSPPSAETVGLRVLHGLTERVRHEQFHGVDVLMFSVDSRPL